VGGGGGASTGSVTSALQSVISYAAAWGHYGQAFMGGVFHAIGAALGQIVGQVVALFQYLAQTWLGQIIKGIWDKLKAIFAAVQGEIKRIMTLLQQYEKMVRYWQQKILGPILNIIQAMRKTLVIFRIFHVKQAVALDNYLSGIEGRLANTFLYYQRALNLLIDDLNFIIDPWGLVSEGLFIRSAVRSIGAVWAGVMGYPSAGITAAQTSAAQVRTQFYTAHSQAAYMHGLAAGGANPDDAAIIAAQKQGYAQLGYKV